MLNGTQNNQIYIFFFPVRLIKTIELKNFTRPESIVTTSDNMYITFTAKPRDGNLWVAVIVKS